MVEIVISVTNVLAENYYKNHHVSFIYLLFFAGRLFMYKRLVFFFSQIIVQFQIHQNRWLKIQKTHLYRVSLELKKNIH